jgi:hypothetical protein
LGKNAELLLILGGLRNQMIIKTTLAVVTFFEIIICSALMMANKGFI